MIINKTIYIIGAGGHGKVVADVAKKNKYEKIYFLDDNVIGAVGDYKVMGSLNDIEKLYQEDKDAHFFVAIGNNMIRKKVYLKLKEICAKIPYLIHPSAIIDDSVIVGEGTIVMANVVINADSRIGKGCIINTSSSVDHDDMISDFVHVSPGVHLAGAVKVGTSSWIGIGCNVSNNVNITSDVIIGAGTTVISDVREAGKYVGLPLRRLN